VIKSSKTLPEETYLKSWASMSPISSDQCVRIILEFYGIFIQRATVQETPDIYLTSLLVLAHFVLLLLYFVYPALQWRYIIWHTYFHVCCKMYLCVSDIESIYLYLVSLLSYPSYLSTYAAISKYLLVTTFKDIQASELCISDPSLNDLSEHC